MIRSLLDVLFPPVCSGCGDLLVEGEEYLCLDCLAHLPRSFYHLQPDDNPMIQRFAGLFPFVRATSWLLYSHGNIVSRLIHEFKYFNRPQVAARVGQLMAEELAINGFFNDIDAIIPMAQHWTRRMKRGYNQAEYLADGISQVTGLEVTDNLRAAKRHRTQTRVSLDERRTNPRGSFRAIRPEELAGRHILLIDDVCTTGATLTEAALTLHRAALSHHQATLGNPYNPNDLHQLHNSPLRLSLLTLASTI